MTWWKSDIFGDVIYTANIPVTTSAVQSKVSKAAMVVRPAKATRAVTTSVAVVVVRPMASALTVARSTPLPGRSIRIT